MALAAQAADTTAAVELLRLNVENHPEWMGSYEAMGDLYRARGERREAISWYRRALELAPDHPRLLEKLLSLSGGG